MILAFTLSNGVGTNFFVVLFQGSQVFTSLSEFALLHTLRNIPMDEGTLGEHQVEVLVSAAPNLSDGSGVGDHEAGTLDLSKIAAWDDSGWLIVDTNLETSWAPVDELDGSFGLDDGDGSVDVLWNDVSTIHHAACHVLSVAWVALNHHVGWLEASVGDFGNSELLMVSLLSRDEWGIGAEWEVDTWVWDQVGLELSKIDVQSAVKTEGCSHGRDHLGDDSVDVGVCAPLYVQVAVTDVIHSLVVNHEGTVRVLQHAVGCVNCVVGLNDGDCDVDRWVDDELKLGLSAVVNRQTLEQQGTETGTSTTSEGVEQDEALQTRAIIGQLSDAVENQVNNLLSDRVVSTRIVVGGILLTRDQLLWVVDLAVSSCANFVDDGWLQIQENGTWDVLSGTSLREERVESVFTNSDCLV